MLHGCNSCEKTLWPFWADLLTPPTIFEIFDLGSCGMSRGIFLFHPAKGFMEDMMKKVLLSTAAIAGLALAAAPASAEEPALQLGIGGYISGYAVYTDNDDYADDTRRQFDFRKDTEVHLSGEVALDNGITAGAHLELLMDRADGGNTVQESYMYLSSSWGRINFGEEDGAAYLLQVAAPSADDKIDGIRPDIDTFAYDQLSSASAAAPAAAGADLFDGGSGALDYDQAMTGYANKFTYITPVFNGFQGGLSFTPPPSSFWNTSD